MMTASEMGKKGGRSKWKRMTSKQRKSHIDKMVKARLKKLSTV